MAREEEFRMKEEHLENEIINLRIRLRDMEEELSHKILENEELLDISRKLHQDHEELKKFYDE